MGVVLVGRPQISCRICGWVTTRPALRSSSDSSAYSLRVNATGSPCRATSRRTRSTRRWPSSNTGGVPSLGTLRVRSSARTRAISSCVPNGLVT